MRNVALRQHEIVLHSLLRRRSFDEKWPRRLALLSMILLVVYASYVLLKDAEHPEGGVWESRKGNTADRRVRNTHLGLPASGSEVHLSERDDVGDSGFAVKGAIYAAKIIDFVSEHDGVGEYNMWIDAGLAVHYGTKTKCKIKSHNLLAVGMLKTDNDVVLARYGEFPKDRDCSVQRTATTVSPDAGWFIECNTVEIRVLLYEDYNRTHLYLPWPRGYTRCLHCTTDDLYLLKDAVSTIVECGVWSKKSTLHGHTYCPSNIDAYLSNWTGTPDWAELHTGHMFNHAALTRAVHYTFYAVLRFVVGAVLLVVAVVIIVLLATKASMVMKRD